MIGFWLHLCQFLVIAYILLVKEIVKPRSEILYKCIVVCVIVDLFTFFFENQLGRSSLTSSAGLSLRKHDRAIYSDFSWL